MPSAIASEAPRKIVLVDSVVFGVGESEKSPEAIHVYRLSERFGSERLNNLASLALTV